MIVWMSASISGVSLPISAEVAPHPANGEMGGHGRNGR
jgi:hypothetical protein